MNELFDSQNFCSFWVDYVDYYCFGNYFFFFFEIGSRFSFLNFISSSFSWCEYLPHKTQQLMIWNFYWRNVKINRFFELNRFRIEIFEIFFLIASRENFIQTLHDTQKQLLWFHWIPTVNWKNNSIENRHRKTIKEKKTGKLHFRRMNDI